MAGDVTNPAYESMLRDRIAHLVRDIGIDGFKEDWLGGISRQKDLVLYGDLFGIEFLRRFQAILHEETHRWKPDALIETQTPHPLFRESSDMLRLNDIWFGSRDPVTTHRIRARIARIAGWDLIDCDNASQTHAEGWWDYMLSQPSIGIPSLYFVSCTESTFETIPDFRWRYLAALWNDYIADNVSPTPSPSPLTSTVQ